MKIKTLKLFLESFKKDEEELQSGMQISNINLAHSLALTTCSFEFECYVKPWLASVDNRAAVYHEVEDQIIKVYKTKNVLAAIDYHVSIPTQYKIEHPNHWFIEYDGSLKGGPEGMVPIEIISPWIPAKDAAAFIKKFKRNIFDFFKGVTQEKTGMHVNLKTKNLVANPLKLLYLLDHVEELEKFRRSDSTFALPHDLKKIALKIRKSSYQTHYDLTNPEVMKHIVSIVIDVLDRDKYKSVNFKDYNFKDGSGRIEFRIIGDDYLGDLYEKTVESVNKFVMLMVSATDDAHDEEVSDRLKDQLEDFTELLDRLELYLGYAVMDKLTYANQYVELLRNFVNIPEKITETKIFKQAIETLNNYTNIFKTLDFLNDFNSLKSIKRHSLRYYFAISKIEELYYSDSRFERERMIPTLIERIKDVDDPKEKTFLNNIIHMNKKELHFNRYPSNSTDPHSIKIYNLYKELESLR